MNKAELEMRLQNKPFGQLYTVVYELLFDEIINMKLVPGMKLSETQIANELEISRTPVSDALKLLEENQLISKLPGKGYVVSSIDIDDCEKIYQVRTMIEAEAVYNACKNITPENLDELEATLQKMHNLIENIDLDEYYALDNHFHDIIINASGNEYLCQAYDAIKYKFIRYRAFIIYVSKGKTKYSKSEYNPYTYSYNEHQALFYALKFGFSEVARKEMEYHLNHMREDIKLLIKGISSAPSKK